MATDYNGSVAEVSCLLRVNSVDGGAAVGGYQGSVPWSRPSLGEDEIASAVAVLRSGWTASGPKTAEFEDAFRELAGAPYALAVESATAGLHLVLAALGVGPGDEVITPSLTWPATANVAELLGARAVFADVLPGTLLLDPAEVRRLVTDRTKAVFVVHYAGAPADLARLRTITAEHGITLVHDAAHALGTWYGDEFVGAGTDPAVFSFHPVKNITTAEGGMVTLGDGALAERIRLLRYHGLAQSSWTRHRGAGGSRYEVLCPGWKYVMSDLNAAIGLVQLGKLDTFNARRTALAHRYSRLLADLTPIHLPEVPPYPHRHAWHLYAIRLDLAALAIDRDEFATALADSGIGAGIHFTPVHMHRYYREREPHPRRLPVTEAAGQTELSLPLYPDMTEAQQDRVVAAVRTVAQRHSSFRVR